VAHVDHAAVVELLAAAAVRVPPAVESARDGEREAPAGVEQAAIVLAEPLAVVAELGVVAVGPEAPEEGGAVGAVRGVEPGQIRIRGDRLEVGPVAGDDGRVGRLGRRGRLPV
jgi:hypothetical protein